MTLAQSKALLQKAVQDSYLNFEESLVRNDNYSQIEIRAIDPITGAAATVSGKVDAAGNLERIGYQNFGRPFESGVDISKYTTTLWVDVDDAGLFASQLTNYLNAPIPLTSDNAQSFVNVLAQLPGVSKTKNSSDVSLSLFGGGRGNTWFESPISLGWKSSGIKNTTVNGREFLSDEVDSLTGQANLNKALMGGDDYLEVTGGSNNFANGNRGADYFVIRGGEGRYLGGRDNDKIEVIDAVTGSRVNGNQGSDFVSGGVAGVTYRGGADNDLLAVSAGTVWGDKGADTFQAIAGEGVAIVQDYTAGEDLLKGIAGGSFTLTEQGLSYGVGGDQMLLLAGITDASQVTLI